MDRQPPDGLEYCSWLNRRTRGGAAGGLIAMIACGGMVERYANHPGMTTAAALGGAVLGFIYGYKKAV